MVEFKTVSGSVYLLDTDRKWVSGGSLPHPCAYTGTPNVIIGEKAIIELHNGGVLKTSVVVASRIG